MNRDRASGTRSGVPFARYVSRKMTAALELLRNAKRPGFLFAGGAARCVFQIGVVETLYELGIEPALCLGVSGGAWNAAAVAVGNWRLLRNYWRFFSRMPYVDVTNLVREHSPFIWSRLHDRAFSRYVGAERLRAESTLPLYVALTRLRDRTSVIADLRTADHPLELLIASNFLPPFYTHPAVIDGEKYGDGGWTNNLPYETMFALGCDAVVLMTQKGESEGGLYRHSDDVNHVIGPEYASRVVVIQPRHRMPLGFVERRWQKLLPIAELGALRTREVLLGERHAQTDIAAPGRAFSEHLVAIRNVARRLSLRT